MLHDSLIKITALPVARMRLLPVNVNFDLADSFTTKNLVDSIFIAKTID